MKVFIAFVRKKLFTFLTEMIKVYQRIANSNNHFIYGFLKGSKGQFLVEKYVPCQENPFTLLWFLTTERVKQFKVLFFPLHNESNTISWRFENW